MRAERTERIIYYAVAPDTSAKRLPLETLKARATERRERGSRRSVIPRLAAVGLGLALVAGSLWVFLPKPAEHGDVTLGRPDPVASVQPYAARPLPELTAAEVRALDTADKIAAGLGVSLLIPEGMREQSAFIAAYAYPDMADIRCAYESEAGTVSLRYLRGQAAIIPPEAEVHARWRIIEEGGTLTAWTRHEDLDVIVKTSLPRGEALKMLEGLIEDD